MRSFARFVQDHVLDNGLFDALERASCRRGRIDSPPVFIVGPPKSGTTLFYQLLLMNFEFSFISNLSSLSPSLPALATRLSKPFFRRADGLKADRQGFIPGLWSPSEAGALMNKWFGDHPSGSPERSIDCIQRSFRAPFLNKNTHNSGRIGAILGRLPGSVIVHMKRDLLDNTVSNYLQARKSSRSRFGYYPETDLRFDNLPDREAWRVVEINRRIEASACAGGARYLRVQYEDLCRETEAVLASAAQALESFGVKIARRNTALPALAPKSSRQTMSPEEIGSIRRSLESLQATP